MIRFPALACAVALFASGSAVVSERALAQRAPLEAPAVLRVTPAGGYRVTLTVEARETLELAADRRLLRVEIRDARNRRASCAAAVRPRPEARARRLAPGERWAEWLDVRELCWGRSLAALEDAREVTFYFDAGRGRGAWVARTSATTFRSLAPVSSTFRAPPAEVPPRGPLRVTLAPVDVAVRGRATLRVRVVGSEPEWVRAFIRPEHVSFRVTTQTGGHFECALPPYTGRALPDFFARLTSRRGVAFALDAVRYCGPFVEPGIHEITPVLALRESGAPWRIAALTGTFAGPGVALRVRSSAYVEQPAEVR
ncbi:MAG: hypothetical protein ACK6CU_07820 [Deltaproteobacteria bacterium]